MEQVVATFESGDLGLDLWVEDLACGEINQLYMIVRI